MNNTLIVIDAQFSFCHPGESMFVSGSVEDLDRLASFVKNNVIKIDNLILTKDNHPKHHISHPCWWRDKNGLPPDAFTVLSLKDNKILNQDGIEFFATRQVDEFVSKKYISTVKNHTIWPEHCLQNTIGSTFTQVINDMIYDWESVHQKSALVFHKGENKYTEELSAIQPEDKTLDPNWLLLDQIRNSQHVYWAGEALSHCFSKTVVDAFELISKQYYLNNNFNWHILKDATSAIPGYDDTVHNFINFCTEKGISFTDCSHLI